MLYQALADTTATGREQIAVLKYRIAFLKEDLDRRKQERADLQEQSRSKS
jgi:hypothetical protein